MEQTHDAKTVAGIEALHPHTDHHTAHGNGSAGFVEAVHHDYKICCISREASILARKEVLTGKAKFGIVGDGKEVPQVAMARAFQRGDIRSGYYRDQTFMLAAGLMTVENFFAQLYADPENDVFSAGRQMNGHFATDFLDKNGTWLPLRDLKNVSADIAPTAGQMSRALGLAMASSVYRSRPELTTKGSSTETFSHDGNEVCFCTIGDASTSEGVFWETLNAAAVTQVPLAVSVWDDGYGISVSKEYQTARGSISEALAGFQAQTDSPTDRGIDIYRAKAWDYPTLCAVYEAGIERVRTMHRPALFHIEEVTQPQGHSTSGSHERYKSPERLEWERDADCIKRMGEWMLEVGIATEADLEALRTAAKTEVREAQKRAWNDYAEPIRKALSEVTELYAALEEMSVHKTTIRAEHEKLTKTIDPLRRDLIASVKRVLRALGSEMKHVEREESTPHSTLHPSLFSLHAQLQSWLSAADNLGRERYRSHLHSETTARARAVEHVPAIYSDASPTKNGYEILNAFFDAALTRHPELLAYGEDVGKIGDVNQGFMGLQEKHGIARVFDTGIREWTIIGQGIGMAMRGLRPIAEIQYLDYLLYGLTPLADDLATLQYRTKGKQRAPLIIRTRGHRLEGIWHTGSPIGMILSTLRGINVVVPRNMTQAAGFYNTLLKSDEPGLVIECLNGYRLKERQPDNLADYTLPLGIPEVLQNGTDVTLVTYGSCVRVAQEGIALCEEHGISVELIDVQSLLPFDVHHSIVKNLEKTNRLVVLDEDVPGGASAYILREILEVQGGYRHLDSAPCTITAFEGRSAYGSDGDYFSKPSADTVFESIYALMRETNPHRFPELY